MKKFFFGFFVSLIFFLLINLFFFVYVKAYTLQVPLPQLTSIEPGSSALAVYIGNIYKFACAVAGILAVVMIVLGGYRYIFSAGNQKSIGEAKGMISSALLGLVLVFCSYLLLRTLNPALVSLKMNIPNVTTGALNLKLNEKGLTCPPGAEIVGTGTTEEKALESCESWCTGKGIQTLPLPKAGNGTGWCCGCKGGCDKESLEKNKLGKMDCITYCRNKFGPQATGGFTNSYPEECCKCSTPNKEGDKTACKNMPAKNIKKTSDCSQYSGMVKSGGIPVVEEPFVCRFMGVGKSCKWGKLIVCDPTYEERVDCKESNKCNQENCKGNVYYCSNKNIVSAPAEGIDAICCKSKPNNYRCLTEKIPIKKNNWWEIIETAPVISCSQGKTQKECHVCYAKLIKSPKLMDGCTDGKKASIFWFSDPEGIFQCCCDNNEKNCIFEPAISAFK